MRCSGIVILLLACCQYLLGDTGYSTASKQVSPVASRSDELFKMRVHPAEMNVGATYIVSPCKDDQARQQPTACLSQYSRNSTLPGIGSWRLPAGVNHATDNNSLTYNYPSHTFW